MPDVENAKAETIADQVAPAGDIDFDGAVEAAERRLEGEPVVPVAEVVEEKVAEAAPVVAEPVVVAEEKAVATPDETQEEPADHKERTKLGRKVADLERNISTLLEQNKTLIERLVAPKQEPEPEREYVDLSTPEGLDRFLTEREQARTNAAQKDKITYGLGYGSEVKDWMEKAQESKDPDVTEIHKLLTGDTPFNVRRSSDPKGDFEFNLNRAEAHYYKQKAKTPVVEKKPPLQNEPPRAPLAVGGESKVDVAASVKPVKMSPAAMEFAKAQGWGDEEVSKILSAPVQNSFVKGRR
jgi:hypothetical protein